eukprot:m.244079 g.244079  ORF g.244079 m.244079 type:complete len:261 (-) comp33822_c0_seq1:4953-5735(-)
MASQQDIINQLRDLFQQVAGAGDVNAPEFVPDENGTLLRSKYLHPKGIDRETFKSKLTWQILEDILGQERMKSRFTDLDGDGKVDMDDVWLQLDTNADSTITVEEFVSECLGEPYFTPEDAEEVYGIYRDQEEEMPIEALGDALSALGLNPTEAELSEIKTEYDTNADGKIDLEEWATILKKMAQPVYKADRAMAREYFQIIAKDNDFIQTDELTFVAKNLGVILNASETKEMLVCLDMNGDGKIQYEEFVPMLQKIVGP